MVKCLVPNLLPVRRFRARQSGTGYLEILLHVNASVNQINDEFWYTRLTKMTAFGK